MEVGLKRDNCSKRKQMSEKYITAVLGTMLRDETHFTAVHILYRVFSSDVMVAVLVSPNKEMAAMLVSPTNPLGIELYYVLVEKQGY